MLLSLPLLLLLSALLFGLLPLSPAQVAQLREDHGIYMAGSGRINLAGLTASNIDTFARALNACLQGEPA